MNQIENKSLYTDEHIDIFEDHLVLKGYYFLKYGQKKILFSEIESLKEVRLVYFNGLSRHEQVWLTPRWPFDWKVKDRKEGILLKLRGKFLGIGISAINPREVALILLKKLNS